MVLDRTLRTFVVAVLLLAAGAPYARALAVPEAPVCRAIERTTGPAHRVRLLRAGQWSTYGAVRVDSLGISGVPSAPVRGTIRDELLEKNRELIGWADLDSLQVPRPQGFPIAATLGFAFGAGIVAFDPEGSGPTDPSNLGPALGAGAAFGLLAALIGRALQIGRSDWVGVALR